MNDKERRTDAKTILETIAAKANVPLDNVKGVLSRHGVLFKPSLAVPKRLCICSLELKGQKQGDSASGPIDFSWKNLGPGIWAITSGRNLRGKSTLLSIIRWCLTGRRGDGMPGEMKDWFRTVRLAFKLDTQTFKVELSNAVDGTGTLTRLEDGIERVLINFGSDEEFETAMSDFFMGQLGLQRIVSFAVRNEQGIEQSHDWVWLSGAIVIEPNPNVLFGSVAVGGLSTRMMQMYLGVQWTNANSDIVAAQSRLKNENRQATNAIDRTRERRKSRIKVLDEEIEELEAQLIEFPSQESDRAALHHENTSFAEAERRRRSAVLLQAGIDADLNSARETYARARRDLQDFKDNRAAHYVFRSLEPVCCPRCDEVFDEGRKAETRDGQVCLVCGTPDQPEEDPGALEARLKEAIVDADAEVKRQRQRQDAIVKTINDAKEDMDRVEKACRDIEARLAGAAHRSTETELIRKLAQKEELANEDMSMPQTDGDAAVLQAAKTATEKAFRPLQEDLLAEVSELILDYAKRFGVENLEEVKLLGNTNLQLQKGGVKVWFGKQTPGEKVRLKVAATLAVLKVAEVRGMGRHPGLLLIDSPGGNEMVSQDYDNLIAGLTSLAGEIPHLQVLIAAIDSDTVRAHVPENRRLSAAGDNYLW